MLVIKSMQVLYKETALMESIMTHVTTSLPRKQKSDYKLMGCSLIKARKLRSRRSQRYGIISLFMLRSYLKGSILSIWSFNSLRTINRLERPNAKPFTVGIEKVLIVLDQIVWILLIGASKLWESSCFRLSGILGNLNKFIIIDPTCLSNKH